MNCGCENTREIFPECDKTRWEVQCSSYIEDADNYYTKKQVDDLIESATTSGSCCITPEEVDEKIESAKTEIEAEIPSLSGYATEQWVLDKHYISGVDLSDYALKSEIPTVPTSNTAFTNDAGYLTEHQSLTAYSTTNDVNTLINQAVSGKQDTLSAGTNITIVDNVISATGGGTTYTAGRGISIDSGNTISLDLPIFSSTGTDSIVEGYSGNTASGVASHAEGNVTVASGNFAHAEGNSTSATSNSSHAEGQGTLASNTQAHAEGSGTLASGYYAHSEGYATSATSNSSHAEGFQTLAKGYASHSEGYGTKANNQSEHASGKYNVSNSGSTDADKTLFSVGNGTADNARHNAFEIRQNGDIYITSGGTDIKLQDHIGGGTATTYTAGDNITISNQNVISTITKFWCGTQQQYDAITTKDPNTVYMIHS